MKESIKYIIFIVGLGVFTWSFNSFACNFKTTDNLNDREMQEFWKDVPGYEGYYQVSNLGRVKSITRRVISTTGKKYVFKGRVLKFKPDKRGYDCPVLCKNHIFECKKAHRLVAEAFIPNPKKKKTVNHKNGIKTDNRAKNLEWLSFKENSNHAKINLLFQQGSDRHNSILNSDLVRELRLKFKSGISATELSLKYGINRTTIYDAVMCKTWKSIKD